MVKVLVTGGAGFIGSNFVRYALDAHPDWHITNLDKLTYAGNLANLDSCRGNPRLTFVKGDILDVELVDELVSEADCVVHFAAESHVDRSINCGADFVMTNVVGTQTLLDAGRRRQGLPGR